MKTVRGMLIAMLAFLGLSALAGSIPMLIDPSGQLGRMPLSLLDHSPFHSYLIPGVLLLVANGLLALFVLLLAIRGERHYGALSALQGVVLLGWLVIECLLMRTVIWAHYLYGGVALALIVAAMVHWRHFGQRPPAIWTV